MDHYDIGIIGAGVAGAFAAYRISQKSTAKTILFELGRPPGKRRRQLEGFLGSFPFGDGKLYTGDLNKLLLLDNCRRVKSVWTYVDNIFHNIHAGELIKDKLPNNSVVQQMRKQNYSIELNDYVQWKPQYVHILSKFLSENLENNKNITLSFDNEVFDVKKEKNHFIVNSAEGKFYCEKIIMCVGRSGWRWVTKLYKDLGIEINDDYANFGIAVEIAAQYLKYFDKSHCSLIKNNLKIGPFSWYGSVIPEDHADMVISSFRSNEERWKSTKVFFPIISSIKYEKQGTLQTERLAKLAFLLFNDRISKEKIKLIIKNDHTLKDLPEYSWLKSAILDIADIIPEIVNHGNYYVPTILTQVPKIKTGSYLESEINNLFIAGESSGNFGVLTAANTGVLAADGACKNL